MSRHKWQSLPDFDFNNVAECLNERTACNVGRPTGCDAGVIWPQQRVFEQLRQHKY